MTLISKIVYIDELDDVVNQNNYSYHSTIKMKPVDVRPTTKNPKVKIGDIVRISKYKNIFVRDHIINWCEESFFDFNC